jgi:hypothetical protein
MSQTKRPYNEAGRRLKAALLSYQFRLKGVDYTLKQLPEDAGEEWAQLAESLLRLESNASHCVSLHRARSRSAKIGTH